MSWTFGVDVALLAHSSLLALTRCVQWCPLFKEARYNTPPVPLKNILRCRLFLPLSPNKRLRLGVKWRIWAWSETSHRFCGVSIVCRKRHCGNNVLFPLCISSYVVQYRLVVSIPWTFLNGTKALTSCPSKQMVVLACFIDYKRVRVQESVKCLVTYIFKSPNDGIVLKKGRYFFHNDFSLIVCTQTQK